MPVLSAVFTLSGSADRQQEVHRALAADPRITLGPAAGSRLPVVLESSSRGEDKALWTWAAGLPGVLFTELVFADFSDLYEPHQESQS